MNLNIKLVNLLISVLADTQVLLLKTQNYHWNVRGINFKSLHDLFEEQYTELFEAVDEIAELIGSLGNKTPATWKEYSQLTSLSEGDSSFNSIEMIANLAKDQQVISDNIKHCLEEAESIKDDATVDAMTVRLAVHRKNHWMLNNFIEGN
jgi:starvation-inducible DNA-binding protein